MADAEQLTRREAEIITDALLRAGLIEESTVDRAVDIAEEEIDARKAVGDY
jgi:hypothetical protein